MKAIRLSYIIAAGLTMILAVPVTADDLKTKLSSYEETPLTLNSKAVGSFKARIGEHGASIEYELNYQLLSSAITQSHIHFGRPGLSGGVALFLCTNGTPPAGVPAPQLCPAAPATITGTLTAADVIALPNQGIDTGAAGFAEIMAAIKSGAAYVNVHTTRFPSGEIRGGLGGDEHSHH